MAIENSAWLDLEKSLEMQKHFTDKFISPNIGNDEKRQQTMSIAISMQSEIVRMCDSVDYKNFNKNTEANLPALQHKLADLYRYTLALLNLWNVSADKFSQTLESKDKFLNLKWLHSLNKRSEHQPVVLFDMDDVLARFRQEFCHFGTFEKGVKMNEDSNEYYCVSALKEAGINNEDLFKEFVSNGGMKRLMQDSPHIELLKKLKDAGAWITVITARPDENADVKCDTYAWFYDNHIDVDEIVFAKEKLSWLTGQNFYGKVPIIAVDDSAKHSMEYAKHGIKCYVPIKSYNTEACHKLIRRYDIPGATIFNEIMNDLKKF